MQNNRDFQTSSYYFDLPEEFIATRPCSPRDQAKLLVYHQATREIFHARVSDLPSFLTHQEHLVFNNSKVIPSRLWGEKKTGGRAEILFLNHGEVMSAQQDSSFLVMIKCRGRKKIGDLFKFSTLLGEIVAILPEGQFQMKFNVAKERVLQELMQVGYLPLPPYIRGGISDAQDLEDYQTIFAQPEGSIAAPTAGLHFTSKLLSDLAENGNSSSFVTLHVGAGTFKPIETADIRDHHIHTEYYSVTKEQQNQIVRHQNQLIAVGTTSLRVLESCWEHFRQPIDYDLAGRTNIFLYPGKKIQSVTGLMTNFHLPGSTLMALVSALVGREKLLELYQIAMEHKYRFYSYGDAMLILR